MLTVLILLTLPVLAGALLALDHYIRFSASRDELATLAWIMRVMGLSLAAAGVVVMGLAAFSSESRLIWRLFAGVYGLEVILTAVAGNAFGSPRDPATLREEARGEQRSSLFRLLCWIALFMPLAPVIPVAGFVVPLILTTVLASWGAVNRGSQISLLWRLSIAAENHLPYAEVVEASASGAGAHRREALAALANRLRDGQSLSDAIDETSSLLPRGDILAIRATDGTPALASVLRDSASRSVRNLSQLRDGGDSLPLQAYFINVVLIVVVIVGFLMYWIVPKFKEIFNDFGVELPPVTRAMIDAADFTSGYWFIVGPAIFLPAMLLVLSPLIALAGWENLNFPLLMRWFPRRDAPEVLRTIAAVVDSGRPLGLSLQEIARHHPREDLRGRLDRIASELEQGEFSWSILCHDGFLKRNEAATLDAAAANNHLSWAMRTLADTLDARQRIRAAWAFEWQRPVLIGALGAIVAFVCIGMFLPLIHCINQLAEQTS